MIMKSMDGIKAKCEYVTNDYITVNNCGCVSTDRSHFSSRPDGRKDHTLIYVKDGRGVCTIDGKKIPICTGDAIVWRPFEPLIFEFFGASSSYWLHFTGTGVDKILSESGVPENGCIHVGEASDISKLLFSMILEMQMNRETSAVMCAGYFMQLIATIGNFSKKNHTKTAGISKSKIYPALEAMMSEYFKNHKLSYYASLCNLSLSHFKGSFTKELNMSPTSYIIKLKIEHAKNAVCFTDLSISEIAHLIGFSDPMYFSRFFKKHIGVSPREFRESIN